MLKSLTGVSYRVADLEKAKQWYRRILGKEPVLDSPLAVAFEIGGSRCSLLPIQSTPPGSDESVVAFWGVDDIEAAWRQLLEAGAAPHTEVMRTVLGSKIARVIDPFGNILGLTGTDSAAKAKSLEDQPSESALGVAFCRALAAHDEREEIRGPDYLAEIFLTEDAKKPLRDPTARAWVLGKVIPPGSYEYFVARTAFFDGIVRRALQENLPQVVFLGAGYDTRPYRFANLIQGTRIFELDIESTQARKRELLERAKVPIPLQLSFVPVNFTQDSLEEVLFHAGFDRDKKALFLWEGVTYYLPAQAVDRTLEFVRRNSPVDSRVCFDYRIQAPDMASRYGVRESAAAMRASYRAEPIQSGIPEGTIEPFLFKRGYRMLTHLTAEDLERNYLTLRDGSSAGKVLACFGLVEACVAGGSGNGSVDEF